MKQAEKNHSDAAGFFFFCLSARSAVRWSASCKGMLLPPENAFLASRSLNSNVQIEREPLVSFPKGMALEG